MAAIDRIAFSLGRRDEVPNQELARALAKRADRKGIQEIAEGLESRNSNVQSDCLKVLYEIGYLRPDPLAPYADKLLALLGHKRNRMVWGAMIGLGTIASLDSKAIWPRVDEVISAIDRGSLITEVWGVRVLAAVAAGSAARMKRVMPRLAMCVEECKARDVPTHLESMMPIITASTWKSIAGLVEKRKKEMTSSHLARLRKALGKLPAGVGP